MFRIPKKNNFVKTGWLAYPLTLQDQNFFSRTDLQIYLEKNGVQTRTIFTGNILKQPLMKNKKFKKHPYSSIESNRVMKNGILIGCHHGLKKNDINYICGKIKKFLDLKIK